MIVKDLRNKNEFQNLVNSSKISLEVIVDGVSKIWVIKENKNGTLEVEKEGEDAFDTIKITPSAHNQITLS